MEKRLRSLYRDEEIRYWKPEGVRECLTASAKVYVGLMRDGCTVLKYPQLLTEDALQCLIEEGERFRFLGKHDNLVAFKGFHKDGLLFEYCARGSLYDVIQCSTPLSDIQKRAIGKQITSCLVHLHSRNFIHCDLNVRNVFITLQMEAKVGDIQGQLYESDGTIKIPTMSQENAKSRHPEAGEDEFSPRTDIFSLGTLLYYLWRETPPFPDLDEHIDEEEIQARYRKGEYPISKATGIDAIIYKCWHSDYKTAEEVLNEMSLLECEPLPMSEPDTISRTNSIFTSSPGQA